MRQLLISLLLATSLYAAYDKVMQVGPTRAYKTIQTAVNNCQGTESCEILVDAGTYKEQVSITGKHNIWLHGADSANLPVVQWLDTLSTHPKDNGNGDGSDNWSYYSERNGVIRITSNSDSIRISHLKVDAVRHFSYQWENVWGSRWQFNGNAGVSISGSKSIQVDHCDIYNAWWGIRFKDRNTGAVYASLDQWEIDKNVATTTPFSNFGKSGDHLFQYNRIHDNVWGFYAEQTWDLPSTMRYNLVYNNKADTSKDFDCSKALVCGVPYTTGGDRQYHAGGMIFLKDAMLVPHILHNNTLYGNPQTVAGYYKAGKNHVFYNNIVDQHTVNLSAYPEMTQFANIFYGYGNAHNNVLSDNSKATFPLFGASDPLWVTANLDNGGTAPVDSFVAPAGRQNFWYNVPSFQSTDPKNSLFLCPTWSNTHVQRTILDKGWALAGGTGTQDLMGIYTPEAISVGAYEPSGSNCVFGGVQDSIRIQLEMVSPILFFNLNDARMQFQINPFGAADSDFVEVTYAYTGYVDSMPFTNGISAGTITTEKSPVLGLAGLLKMGLNDKTFTFLRSNLGEFGMIRFSVKAKHKNGTTYVSDLEIAEYRRLRHTLQISLLNSQGVAVDTVAKGDTITVRTHVLDINLDADADAVVMNAYGNLINGSGAKWLNNFPETFVGIGEGKFVINSYAAANEILTVGGIVGEVNSPGDTSKYFITGAIPFYIRPAAVSNLVITNTQLTAPQGEPLTITVRAEDVFGELSDEDIWVRLTADNGTLVTPATQIKKNSDGTLSFEVTPIGTIGSKFTLTATVEGSSITSEPVTFSIVIPTQRKVVFYNEPSSNYHFATGDVIPLSVRLVDSQGKLIPSQDFFYLEIRDSKGNITELPSLYYDSLQATSPTAVANNQGQFALTIPSSGETKVYLKWPATTENSDTYLLQTLNIQMTTLYDQLNLNVDVPELVFVDQNGNTYTTLPPIDTVTGYLMPLSVQARVNGIICTQCNDIVFTNPSSSNIHFKTSSNGGDISSFQLVNGESDLFVYAVKQTLDAEFSLYSRDSAVSVIYDNLKFRKPPVPQADSALVYDTNGDGIADSLVVWYAEDIHDSLPDTLRYAWPSINDPIITVPSTKAVLSGSDSILSFVGNLTDEILTDGAGKLNSIYQDNEGQWWNQRIDIQDRIGPVLKRVSLIQSWGTGFDTLLVSLSEALDTSAFSGDALVNNGLTARPLGTQAVQIDDTTWIFLVPKNQVVEGDSLNLFAGVGTPIADILGNLPSSNNQGVLVSLIRRPIPPAQKGNLFQDQDGNGTLDYITLTLLGEVDQEYLENELDSLAFSWIDSTGKVIRVNIPGSAFTIDPEDPRKLHYAIPNSEQFFPFLTSIDPERFGEYGTATLYSTLEGESSISLPVTMADGMPPVIREASLVVSEKDGGRDVLTIRFSEPVSIPSGNSEIELFDLKPQSQTESRILAFTDIEWKNDQEVSLYFGRGISLDMRPSSQDSIRIHGGAMQDLEGILVPTDAEFAKENLLHPSRPYRMVLGDFRFKISSVTITSYNTNDPALKDAPKMALQSRPFGTVVNPKSDFGMVVDVGSVDLLHSVQRAIKAKLYPKDSTLVVEELPVDTQAIEIRLELHLFTNLGGYVASHRQTISCTDEIFDGNCITNPQQLYLKWNFKSDAGRMVGSGVYHAQMMLRVQYASEETSVRITDRNKHEQWGLLRKTTGAGLR